MTVSCSQGVHSARRNGYEAGNGSICDKGCGRDVHKSYLGGHPGHGKQIEQRLLRAFCEKLHPFQVSKGELELALG